MANKTVYPYGRNGKLPSGYPIADDLETYSAQLPLSAKQGVILNDKIELLGTTYSENAEWSMVITDADDRILFGIRQDGSVEWFANVPQVVREFVAEYVSSKRPFTENEIARLKELIETYYLSSDEEGRLELKFDGDGKIVSYRTSDGTLVEAAGVETPRVKTDDAHIDKLKAGDLNVSGNIILSDKAKEYIIKALPDDAAYKGPNLPKYGTTNLKTETFYLTAHEGVESIDDVVCIQDYEDTVANAANRMTISHYYVKSTLTNNGDGTYSINGNSVRLRHYAAGKVKLKSDDKYYAKDPVRKVGGACYYADTLGYASGTNNRRVVIQGYTEAAPADPALAELAVKQTEVEVVQITGPVCVNAWTVEDWDFNASLGADIGKKYEHYCTADVDFGHYLSGTDMAVGVKHQGNSTQNFRKRNFRYTFYKNATFAKKDKKKIGEMLRLSKFNLKANWLDDSRVKELFLYRLFTEIWKNHRPIVDRFDWDGGANGYYHGSTGNINGFPVRFSVCGEFYGIYMFGVPKDGSNYLIDDKDEDTGLFVSGAHNTSNDWGVTLPYVIADHYDSEMDSDLEDYPGIISALQEWTHFINNRLYEGSDGNTYNSTQLTEVDRTMYVTSTLVGGEVVEESVSAELIEFDRENGYKRLDVLGFIDYFICMQVFVMVDSGHNNVMLYSGPEKKKMFPFFYDLDLSIPADAAYDCDVLDVSYSGDTSLWENFCDIYWDDIVNRYCELRRNVLTDSYIRKVYDDIAGGIPKADFISESSRWNGSYSAANFEVKIDFIKRRLAWMDENYFVI